MDLLKKTVFDEMNKEESSKKDFLAINIGLFLYTC